jgi:preprotein translocase subunit SecA
MNQQRMVIYDERRRILEGENLAEQAHKMLIDVITAYVDGATAEGYAEDWDLEQLWTALKQLYPVGIDHHDLLDSDAVGEPGELTREELLDALIADAERAYAEREKELEAIAGDGAMRQLERNVLLNVLDRKWREHLYEMDYLREGIGLRAYSQRDPLVEYQREGFDMFAAMMDGIKEESVGFLFNLEVQVEPEQPEPAVEEEFEVGPALAQAAAASTGSNGTRTEDHPSISAKGLDLPKQPQNLSYSAPSEVGAAEVTAAPQQTATEDPFAGASRNAECPCGSGKKYKKCHGAPGGPTGLTTRVNG